MEALKAAVLAALLAGPVQAADITMTHVPMAGNPTWLNQVEIRREGAGRIVARASEGLEAPAMRRLFQDGLSRDCPGAPLSRRVILHDVVFEADPDFLVQGQAPESSYLRRLVLDVAGRGACHAIAAASAEGIQLRDRMGTTLTASRVETRDEPASGMAVSIENLEIRVAGTLPLVKIGSADAVIQVPDGADGFAFGARWEGAAFDPRFMLGLEGAGSLPAAGRGEIAAGCDADGFSLDLDIDMENLTRTRGELLLVMPGCKPRDDTLLVRGDLRTRDLGLLDLLRDGAGWTPEGEVEKIAAHVPAMLAGLVTRQAEPVLSFLEGAREAEMSVRIQPAGPVGAKDLAPMAFLGTGAVAQKLGIRRNIE